MNEPSYTDDESIARQAVLWRRVYPDWITLDEATGLQRLTTQAFQDSADKTPMSAYIADKTPMSAYIADETPDGVSGAIGKYQGYGLVGFSAGFARDQGQGIMRDPRPSEPSHVYVFGPKNKRMKDAFVAGVVWIVYPSTWRTEHEHDP